MKKICVAVLLTGVALFAGCGESIHWFPGTSGGGGGGATPNPPPSSQTITEVQANTATPFLPYTVAFGNITTSTTTASISVSGDPSSKYSKDNGTTFTSTAGTVKKGDIVIVQNTSYNGSNASISTILNIGGFTATYVSKTGTLIFITRYGVIPGSTVNSIAATVPAIFTNNFVLGANATISLAADSNNSQMFLNGSTYASAQGSPIKAGETLYLSHKAASTANTPVITKATLTGSQGTYDVTFKSVTQ